MSIETTRIAKPGDQPAPAPARSPLGDPENPFPSSPSLPNTPIAPAPDDPAKRPGRAPAGDRVDVIPPGGTPPLKSDQARRPG